MSQNQYMKRDYLSTKQIELYDEIVELLKQHKEKEIEPKLNKNEISEVLTTIVRDYPEYTLAWKDSEALWEYEGLNRYLVKVKYRYPKAKENVMRHSIDTYIKENIIPYVKRANCRTEKEIVTAIYTYLSGTFTCAKEEVAQDGKLKIPCYAYTLETLDRLNGVCQGIALSLIYILRKYDIECFYIRGRTDEDALEKNGGAPTHGWCMVKLDGTYYHLDLTWDLQKQDFQYFLLTDAEMYMKHHRWDYSAYPKAG